MSGARKYSCRPKNSSCSSVWPRSPNRAFALDDLYTIVWGHDSMGDTRTLMVHISNLRKKIEPDPANPIYILTVRGVGYKFNIKEGTAHVQR